MFLVGNASSVPNSSKRNSADSTAYGYYTAQRGVPMIITSPRNSQCASDGGSLVLSARSARWKRPVSRTTISARDAISAYRATASQAASPRGSGHGSRSGTDTSSDERVGWGSDGAGGTVWERERSWPALHALALPDPAAAGHPLCLRHVERALYDRSFVPTSTGIFTARYRASH